MSNNLSIAEREGFMNENVQSLGRKEMEWKRDNEMKSIRNKDIQNHGRATLGSSRATSQNQINASLESRHEFVKNKAEVRKEKEWERSKDAAGLGNSDHKRAGSRQRSERLLSQSDSLEGQTFENQNELDLKNKTENAMKIALEMTSGMIDNSSKLLFKNQEQTSGSDNESGDETTAASDLLLDLSGRDLGKGKRSIRRNQSLANTIETAGENLMNDSNELQLHPHFDNIIDTFENYKDTLVPRGLKKKSSASAVTPLNSNYVDTSKDFIDTANRIKAAAKSARSKKSISEDISDNLADDGQPAPFVVVGQELDTFYYKNKCCKNQKEFLNWTKKMLGFSKSTTYEYIISYRVYSDIKKSLSPNYPLPQYQSHCQLLSKIPSDDLASVWMKICDANGNQMTTTILEDYLKKNQFIDKKRAAPKTRKRSESSSGVGSSTVNKKKKRRRRRDDDDTEEDEISSDHQSEFEDEDLNVISWSQAQASVDSTTQSLAEEPSYDISVLSAKENESPPPKVARTSSVLSKTSMRREPKILQPSSQPPQKPLPFDDDHVFEVAKRVVQGDFDKICRSIREFESLEHETWFGKIYCDLTAARPQSVDQSSVPVPGIERLLQIVFTRYANKEYNEGIFVIRGEFGADWFTPILQHPICILRQHTVRHFLGGVMQEVGLPARFDSYVAFYMGPNIFAFCNQFRNVGYLPGYNCWSYTPMMSSSRSSGGLRSSLGGGADEFPKDFMLNDHSIAPSVSATSMNNQTLGGTAIGLEMPMEDLAASILSHLSG